MANATPIQLFSTDPSVQSNYLQLQQRQAMAQALMQEGLKPVDTSNRQVGGVAYHISPFEGLTKMVQEYSGNKMFQDSTNQMGQVQANYIQGLVQAMGGNPPQSGTPPQPSDPVTQALGAGAAAGSVGPTNDNAVRLGQALQGAQPSQPPVTPAVAPPVAPSGATPQGAPSGGMSGLNPTGLPPYLAAMSLATDPSKYFESVIGQLAPTDLQKTALAAGYRPGTPEYQQLMQGNVRKQNYIPPVRMQAGGGVISPDGRITTMPAAPPPGYQNVQLPDGSWSVNKVANGTDAVASSAEAAATGKQEATPTVAYDANGKPIFSTGGQDLRRARGQPPRAEEPYMAAFDNLPPPQGGMNSTFKGQPDQVLPQIAGIKDPQERSNAYAAYANQLTNGGLTNGPSGAVTPQQPPGLVANAEAAQKASAQTMQESYSRIKSGLSTSNAALDALNKMQALAAQKNGVLQSGPLMAGPLGTFQTSVSPAMAEYEKQRANVIALLANQNGTNGTDAGRALTGESVPDFGKPKAAIADGLNTLKNQVIAQQIKANFLTPSYQAGDSKTYTNLENQFDQNVSPSMVPILTMPAGPARAAALQNMRKQPGMEAKLNWAITNGLIK